MMNQLEKTIGIISLKLKMSDYGKILKKIQKHEKILNSLESKRIEDNKDKIKNDPILFENMYHKSLIYLEAYCKNEPTFLEHKVINNDHDIYIFGTHSKIFSLNIDKKTGLIGFTNNLASLYEISSNVFNILFDSIKHIFISFQKYMSKHTDIEILGYQEMKEFCQSLESSFIVEQTLYISRHKNIDKKTENKRIKRNKQLIQERGNVGYFYAYFDSMNLLKAHITYDKTEGIYDFFRHDQIMLKIDKRNGDCQIVKEERDEYFCNIVTNNVIDLLKKIK